jgi:hypothetical protein
MWFIAHTGTPGCEHVISIDFDKCFVELPKQDTLLESEFELLCMPTLDNAVLAEVTATPVSVPLKEIVWLPIVAFPLPPQAPVKPIPAPPPSPIRIIVEPVPPPPSPISCRSASPTDVIPPLLTPISGKRKHHSLLTDALICKWVDVHGPSWRDLARSMGGRADGWSDDVVRNRYIRIVEELNGEPYERRKRRVGFKKPETAIEKWTEEEDTLLVGLFRDVVTTCARGGVPWSKIATRFGGLRTQQAIRNRASRLGLRGDTQYVTPPN